MLLVLLVLGIGDNLPGFALSDHGGPEKVVRHINCSGTGVTCTSSSTYGTITVEGGGAASTATALAADPSDCSAGQYAYAIAASGDLTCSAVDYSQLTGNPVPTSPAGSIPQVQFNIDGGSFGGVSKVTSPDSTHIAFVTETSLVNGPAANLIPFAFSDNGGPPAALWEVDATTGTASPVGHRGGPIAFRGAAGPTTITTCQYPESHGGATMVNWGATTSLSLTSATGANWDAGTQLGRSRHVSLLSGAGGNTSSSAYQTRATAWLPAGFVFTSRQWFSCGGSSSCRVFVGVAGCVGACAALVQNAEYSRGVNNSAYIGADGPEANLHACGKDLDAGAAQCVDLGGSFPKGAGGYEIWLWAAPNSTTVNYYVTRIDGNAAVASGVINGPTISTQLAWHADLDNTDAGRNVQLDFEGMCAWYLQ